MKRLHGVISLGLSLVFISGVGVRFASADAIEIISGLRLPVKVILTPGRNLLIAEAGNSTPNTGRLSRADQGGNRQTVIDGLPSGPAPDNVQGPAGIHLSFTGKRLLIAIGTGDATVAGEAPGSETPNPDGPSSPIFSTVLRAVFSDPVDAIASPFTLTLDDQYTLAFGFPVTLLNADGQKLTLTVVTDFPDIIRDPVSGLPQRANPFGLDLASGRAFVADASRNSLQRVNLLTGRAQRVTAFDPIPNPLPFGPPVLEAVPTGVASFQGDLLVALETGYPFPVGVAEIKRVDADTGAVEPFITGLTQALDILPAFFPGEGFKFYVVELSTDLLDGAPGRLLRFDDPGDPPVVICDTLLFPSSVARDPVSGDLFLTQSLAGSVVRISD